ncbi:MAG: alpha/beta hydrolase superfamily enzyme predicted hydrolase [Deltaproteobacteria bacterium]|jgi:predicted alpha/beta-hydrolase family hydrolase|nr:alpha/beta hydrolase superfamily enzyme predicted hydrolase [Deltaproteobacteria bacterium]
MAEKRSGGKEIHFVVSETAGVMSGLLLKPEHAVSLLVFAHGAGAGMRHRFIEDLSQRLAGLGVATMRYQFPYMEKRVKRPDSEGVLIATVQAALIAAEKYSDGLPIFAGGKSMGGRMTSLTLAKAPMDRLHGLIFFGFPLHAPGAPSAERGKHLADVQVPMLFIQGSRDALADLRLLKPLCAQLDGRAELFVVEGGDHSLHMAKRSGRTDNEVLDEVAAKTSSWMAARST